MPFVTEYNKNLIYKKLSKKGIPDDIYSWEPYKSSIFFLNRLDKTNLFYFEEFCKNPMGDIDSVYESVVAIDNEKFVYEGALPSYHKSENCKNLSSNFVNYRIPKEIKASGKIEEYRNWFKENIKIFSKDPEIYQFRLQTKFGIKEGLQQVDYENSGNVYKENLTREEIEIRIDSLLFNAAQYYNRNVERQKVIRKYQKATFLAFREAPLEGNDTGYSDEEAKAILRFYYKLFIEPTLYNLREYFRTIHNADIEINEKIFKSLNFKKCSYCYSEDNEQNEDLISERNKYLVTRFGDYIFPIEPTRFHYKEVVNSELRVAFIYCRVYRLINDETNHDELGEFKYYKIEFINEAHKYIYAITKIYLDEVLDVELFRKYLTKITHNKKSGNFEFKNCIFF